MSEVRGRYPNAVEKDLPRHGIIQVISYIRLFGEQELVAELKWLNEFDNKNRPEGDTLFVKVMLKFWGKG